MVKYIPYPSFYDDVPIDISFVFEDEKPAGKHGFLKTAGRDFMFEDGTKVKFWGTNFNGCGCFPDHAHAEILAKRLAKLGLNLVRMHQLDAEWHTPNIFSFAKGKRQTTAEFDPEAMDRLDYLIYCLKEEGIYVYIDMFTYRKFRSDEGVENAHSLNEAAKPYCAYNEKLIELQKDLCERLWKHENPYTKLSYADEPAIVLAEIVNESDLFARNAQIGAAEPYRSEFISKFSAWLKENSIDKNAEDFDLSDNSDKALSDFKYELQVKYYNEMIEFMRNLGVKIPLTGTNFPTTPDGLRAELGTDFLDSHSYDYNWNWGEFEKKCINRAISQRKASYLSDSAVIATADMPTYISEWDVPWPNEFRAEGPIYSAAVGCLQGWSGFAIHTYSYSYKLELMDMLGKEISAEKIGDTPYRQGIFSAWNDPAKFGLFYHAALITRRGDVKEANQTLAVKPFSHDKFNFEATASNLEKSKIITVFDDNTDAKFIDSDTNEGSVTSDTGELFRSWEKEYGFVKTDMTKCAYGQLLKNGEIDLDGVKIKCKTDFAVIALSSLTKDAITKSDNILLTTVGRAQNTDEKHEGKLLLDYGKPPVLIENIEAEIELETNQVGLKVWAVSAEGYYIGTVPTTYGEGKIKFKVGESSRSMYYLIVKD